MNKLMNFKQRSVFVADEDHIYETTLLVDEKNNKFIIDSMIHSFNGNRYFLSVFDAVKFCVKNYNDCGRLVTKDGCTHPIKFHKIISVSNIKIG